MSGLTRRCLFQAVIATLFCGTRASPSAAAEAGKPVTARVAIEGYDPVAYFTEGRPVKGSSAFSFPFDDAIYYFASAEHQKMFAADPDRYAPQYSAYCTFGVSVGVKAEANPEVWAISNGRLHVFGNRIAHAAFIEDSAGIVAKANTNWPVLKDQR